MQEYPSGFILVEHALAKHKLGLMRDRNCDVQMFRRLMRQLGQVLCVAVTQDLPLTPKSIQTPLASTIVDHLDQQKIAVIPILRAGLVFAEAFHELLPQSRTGHLGLFRNPNTHTVERYLASLPSGEFTDFIILDPMIATGETLTEAVRILLDLGVPADRIRVASLIASRTGIERFFEDTRHSGIQVYAIACDPALSDKGYIIPGLGDAGDRLFGTADPESTALSP
jgi:uracil phosphoribosyltransferase